MTQNVTMSDSIQTRIKGNCQYDQEKEDMQDLILLQYRRGQTYKTVATFTFTHYYIDAKI